MTRAGEKYSEVADDQRSGRTRADNEGCMTLNDLIPELRALPRTDKLWVIQMMAAEVAREEDGGLLQAGQAYPVWSPFDAFEGAATLMRVLEQEKDAQ